MELRPLGPADAPAFQEIRLDALRDTPSAFSSSYEEECDTPLATVAGRLAAKPDRCVIGAFENGRLIGVAGLRREGPAKLAHKAVLWGVYVAPDARRRGAGRKLLARTLDEATSMPGLRQVNLSVNSANAAAVALYEALGFTSFGLERGYLKVDGVLYDELHMVRLLP